MRSRRNIDSHIPEVNLIPMMNAMLAILAFFVVVSMTLGNEAGIDVQLPDENAEPVDPQADDTPDPLVVDLGADGQLSVRDRDLAPEELQPVLRAYVDEFPEGNIYLNPDRDLSYERVIQTLTAMREVGEDRVVLAVMAEEAGTAGGEGQAAPANDGAAEN